VKLLYLLLALSLTTAVGFLAVGFAEYTLLAGLGAVLLVIALFRRLEYMAAGGFILLVVAAGLHAWKEAQALLSLSSLCASLAAWDLASYVLLMHATGIPPDTRLIRRRMLRLGSVLVSGWGLGVLALRLELGLSFGWILLLALFVVLSLSISMMYLRQRDERTLPQTAKPGSNSST
jgi:hypothetical protein